MNSGNGFKQTEVGMIPGDWDVRKVGDFVEIKHGYAFKGEFFTDDPNENVVLTPGNFNIGGGFKAEKFKYTREKIPAEYVLNAGDTIVTMTDLSKQGDTLGYAARVPYDKKRRFLHNQRLGLLIFKSGISKDFVYWVLRTRSYNQFVVGSASGSTVKHTSPDRIKQYPFGLPTNQIEQSRIAKILSDLDSKIELNHQMNKTLEAMARAIFMHWFIDFEFPNEEGKPYRSSGGELVSSELGLIPKGWRISTIGKEVEIGGGTTPDTSEPRYWDAGTFHWATPKDLSELPGPVLFDTARKITDQGLKIIGGRLYPRGVLLLSSRAPIGYLAISEVPTAINQGMIAIVAEKRVSSFYMLGWCRLNIEEIENRANGTTFLEISKSSFRDMSILVPPEELMNQFSTTSESIYSCISSKTKESKTLREIRDSLLPKLMSGKIRVPIEVG